ncbi:MAG: 16S rRNA (cytosine(1402)-N(4))-methyltransferase RsmH [Patescibacteria group bacterium]|jgi:16S rRNA (cytosine1402-N4)-methyltransferase
MATIHEPVLLQEVLQYLDPQPGQNFIDCTFGGGGHSLEILERIKPDGKLIGIDLDPSVIQTSSNKNLILVNDNYRNLKNIYKKLSDDKRIGKIDGVLLDLGLSSDQLGARSRGFSFQDSGTLDMRYNASSDQMTAAEILQSYNQKELFRIFKEYGEEPLAWPIAKKIVAEREAGNKIETVEALVQLVEGVYGRHYRAKSKKSPATKVFQALRIAVNDEFGNIHTVLPQAIELLKSGGRLAVISFHSGEDRIIKNYFRDESKQDKPRIKIITKKPIVATEQESQENPRSRSAKLRVIEKTFN